VVLHQERKLRLGWRRGHSHPRLLRRRDALVVVVETVDLALGAVLLVSIQAFAAAAEGLDITPAHAVTSAFSVSKMVSPAS